MCDTDWSNELVLAFLEQYRTEPIIYDPKHRGHKDRTRVYEAWDRISQTMGIPVVELKKKRDALMATFRGLVRKKEASVKTLSFSPSSYVYEPKWFAYDLMAQYLLPVYRSNGIQGESSNQVGQGVQDVHSLAIKSEFEEHSNCETLLTEEDTSGAEASPGGGGQHMPPALSCVEGQDASPMALDPIPDLSSETQINMSSGSQSNNSYLQQSLKRKRPDAEDPEWKATPPNTTLQIPQPTTPPIAFSSTNPHDHLGEEDECDLFSKLLAKKLRKLPEEDRLLIMYEIDGLFINRIRRTSLPDSTPSSTPPPISS